MDSVTFPYATYGKNMEFYGNIRKLYGIYGKLLMEYKEG